MLLDPSFLPSKIGHKVSWGQTHGAASALAITEAAIQHQGPVLVVVADTDAALKLNAELDFFLTNTELDCLMLPDWEILPYDSFSAHPDIISERISTLNQITHLHQGVVIVPVATLLHRLAPVNYLAGNSFTLTTGQNLPQTQFRQRLDQAGYLLTETVSQAGEYALRGGLIDLYPMGSHAPLRIELFDDEIESLRYFDADSQRTTALITEFNLLPAREFPLTDAAISHFRQSFTSQFDLDPKACPVYQDVSQGFAPAGIEYYIPLFFNTMSTLLDYLPDSALVVKHGNIESQASHFWCDIDSRYEDYGHDIERPLLEPKQLFLFTDEMLSGLKKFPIIDLQNGALVEPKANKGLYNLGGAQSPQVAINSQLSKPLTALDTVLQIPQQRVLICAESAGRKEALLDLFKGLTEAPEEVENWPEFVTKKPHFAICIAPLEQGLNLPEQHLIIVSEAQLFGQKVLQRRRRDKATDNPNTAIHDLAELSIGNAVVHQDHGVGRYNGLQSLSIDGQDAEFLVLLYANEATLYVPVSGIELLSRYSGGENAPLHKLGGEAWSKAKRKAAEKIKDTAAELLHIYALREARDGYAFPRPDDSYQAFCDSFPFEETPDQEQAIKMVLQDMMADQPMDRLVCGDVGFGKTEVAMRAAFMAVNGGRQVALLVPTTLLAQQHYETLRDRFANWPVNVSVMSRFQTTAQQNTTMAQAEDGKLDILVGTHKILQGKLKFKRLGLLIIDEEHRFGVQQKESFKKLRSEVDILTLTATPIPRTLNMSMAGMRDLSIIATPPAKRISIKTFVRQDDTKIIKEAILRELLRGGQVYYLHNEVKTIEASAQRLREMVPEARVDVAHGQMRERQLEQVMGDFYHKRSNLLVCSTIIETGIDIPTANTIIIERADKFGLAQLHQLRGRVGRSHHQAYAYLMTPHPKLLSKDANKRLEAIEATAELGAGFSLASHDLEIRGAGELLGEEQSGQMQGIGFSLYMEMLNQTVDAMKKGETPNLDQPLSRGTEVNLHLPALIPENYLPDVHNRLVMYQRIANAEHDAALKELQVEMIDRFGLLPDQIKNLFRQNRLKLKAQAIGVTRIEASAGSGHMEFSKNTQIDPMVLIRLVQTQPHQFKLEGGTNLRFTLSMEKTETRFQRVEDLIKQLS
ncbi:MAG: transcription-repair coupling factor [Gammaproteobacteria bacterium]|nr:transcription-repair coupling factor [Gammaproteobacteria bacterium]